MIAVDTNILIYACDQADPRRQTIALDLITNSSDGVLLWQVACEFLSASRKLTKQGFTATHAWNRLHGFAQPVQEIGRRRGREKSLRIVLEHRRPVPVRARQARGRR